MKKLVILFLFIMPSFVFGGGSRSFDGTSDKYNVNTGFGDFPITVMIRFSWAGNTNDTLFSHRSGSSNNGYRIEISTAGGFAFTLGGVAAYKFDDIEISTDTWYSFVCTVTGDGGTAKGFFFRDGTITEQSKTIGTLSGTPNRYEISHELFDLWFGGLISEVRVYIGIVDDVDIYDWLHGKMNISGDNLRGYWLLWQDQAGDVLTDLSGTGRHMTCSVGDCGTPSFDGPPTFISRGPN